jgi:hypothetical protein
VGSVRNQENELSSLPTVDEALFYPTTTTGINQATRSKDTL